MLQTCSKHAQHLVLCVFCAFFEHFGAVSEHVELFSWISSSQGQITRHIYCYTVTVYHNDFDKSIGHTFGVQKVCPANSDPNIWGQNGSGQKAGRQHVDPDAGQYLYNIAFYYNMRLH